MDVMRCIKTRRSERDFLRKKVPVGIINEILEAGRWAPAAGNLHHVRFVVVEGEKLKKRILNNCIDAYWANSAPFLVVVCSETDEIKNYYGKRGAELYAIQDSAAAVQNMMLAAKNFGVGSCWIGAFSESAIKRAIKTTGIEIHAIVAFGYPRDFAKPPLKLGLANMVYFEKWGEKKRASIFPLGESKPVKKIKKKLKKISTKKK